MAPDRSPLPVGKLDTDLLASLLGGLPTDPSVVVGACIGCDVAVIDTGGDEYLLLKSDPITFATDEIGHYAVTVNVNDIATAGGVPRWFLGTLLLPEDATTPEMVRDIYRQLTAACARYGAVLVGGHTEITYGLDRPLFSGAMVGQVPRDRLVTNDGMRQGDAILLTKAAAVEGTSIIAREKREELLSAGFEAEWLDACAAMLHDPGIGVLEEARASCAAADIHAMHDPTEGGVATGLWEMASAAKVGVRVERDAVPVYPQTARLCEYYGLDPLGLIASGSLLIAVDPGAAAQVISACEQRGIACAQIAEAVAPEAGLRMTTAGGAGADLPRFDQDELTKAL